MQRSLLRLPWFSVVLTASYLVLTTNAAAAASSHSTSQKPPSISTSSSKHAESPLLEQHEALLLQQIQTQQQQQQQHLPQALQAQQQLLQSQQHQPLSAVNVEAARLQLLPEVHMAVSKSVLKGRGMWVEVSWSGLKDPKVGEGEAARYYGSRPNVTCVQYDYMVGG